MLMFSSPSIIASLLLIVWSTASPYTVLYSEAKPQIRQSQSTFRRLDQASSASVQHKGIQNTGLAVIFQDDGRSRATESHRNDTNTSSTIPAPATDKASRATNDGVATQPPTKPPRKKSRAPTSSPISPPVDDDTVGDDAAPDTATKAKSDEVITQPPTKPPRKKSRAPTPSPTSPPIDDDTLGDDAAPDAATKQTTDEVITQPPSRKKSRAPTPSPSAPPIDDDTLGDDAATIETDAPAAVDIKPPVPLLVPTPFPVQPVPPTTAPTSHKPTISPVSIPSNTPTYPRITTVQPSPVYVPIDDDPIVTQDKEVEEDKEEVELEHVQTEAKTAGSIGFLLALCGMIFTAYQMSENPDGIYASVCRLAITIIGCAFKLILMPCRNFLGYRYHAGHIPVSTMEYREPYRGGNSAMELT
ncbi:hypothetical protein MHU86_24948 [Fragilaria crotonensis]|nr:hypothetical protein MHU86_24948 [Fragilaria crotonensis]